MSEEKKETETEKDKDQEPSLIPELKAVVRRNRRWSTVWIVPFIALLLGIWLVWKHYSELGPLVYVRFETAESIAVGKTEVRCRSVRIGQVENLELSKDLNSVVVALRLNPDADELMRDGSRFWVVRPRVSASDISGLGTIITGSYIELDPGEGREGIHHFDGLEDPPVTNSNVPGLRLVLTAAQAGGLNIGSPVYYKGFEVGRVEKRTFEVETRSTRYDIFIQQKYAGLVNEGTRFWNTGGINVTAGAGGVQLKTPSIQAMLTGGISFDVPTGGTPGSLVKDGTYFTLFQDEASLKDAVFTPNRRVLMFFDRSVRGLNKGASVEFRGLQLGRVVDISFKYSPTDNPTEDPRVPVLVEIDTSILRTNPADPVNEDKLLAEAVENGLRAKLSTGSLLTGGLYVDIDFVPDAPPAELSKIGDMDVMPTHSSGMVRIEEKVNSILAKIDALPLKETLEKFGKSADEINATLVEAKATLAEAHKLLAKEETQTIPNELQATLQDVQSAVTSLGPEGNVQGDLRRTLDELRAALRAFKTLSNTIEEKPNSLIFGRENSGNPVPKARR